MAAARHRWTLLVLLPALFAARAVVAQDSSPLRFVSTQLTPAQEAHVLRELLRDFPQPVELVPQPEPTALRDAAAGDVIGALHGQLGDLAAAGVLAPVDALIDRLGADRFDPGLLALASFGEEGPRYVPWMQASYVMLAHRRALALLPAGASLEALRYRELTAWAERLAEAAGRPVVGFPAGPEGLFHRFLQGFLYPSYTGAMVTAFDGEAARAMWRELRSLWRHVHPRSLQYARMEQPLLDGEVWLAWDHTARLRGALRERAQDFVAFPAPIGPAGRGAMRVVSGLAVSRASGRREEAEALIAWLLAPQRERLAVERLGFLRVRTGAGGRDREHDPLQASVRRQLETPGAITALLPAGIGAHGRAFDLPYLLAFSSIVLRGEDVAPVLHRQSRRLGEVMILTGAACWPPDPPGLRPCPVP